MDAGIKPSHLCPSFTSPPEVSLTTVLCCIYVLWRTILRFTSPLLVQGKKQKGVVFVLGQHRNPRMRADSDLLPPSSSLVDDSPHEKELQNVSGSESFPLPATT